MKVVFNQYERRCVDFNSSQVETGSSLKTLKGSLIRRDPKFGIGKKVGSKLYFHKQYFESIFGLGSELLVLFLYSESFVPFEYNIVRWDMKTNEFAFEECPDFDSNREPIVGRVIRFNSSGQVGEINSYRNIFHHKWMMVANNYSGFDVEESWNWSRKWLSTLKETANGNNAESWKAQLNKFNLS